MSLSEKLANLVSLAPESIDPEDDQDYDATAKLTDFNNDESVEIGTKSILRLKNTSLLADDDERYAGKKISRENLRVKFSFNEFGGADSYEKPRSAVVQDVESGSEEDTFDDGSDDNVLTEFQTKIKQAPSKRTSISDEFMADDDSDEMDEDSFENGEDVSDDDDQDKEESDKESGDEDTIQTFSKHNVADDAEKGLAIKTQIKIWDSVLEGRIRLHKSLVAANRLPQHDVWPHFSEVGGQGFEAAAQECQRSTKTLLDSLIKLQTALLEQNPETSQLIKNGKAPKAEAPKVSNDDEEITSESDGGEKPTDAPETKPHLKRKLKVSDYPEFVKKRHSDFQSFRNSAIQTWNDRTKVTTGKVKKSFDSFDVSAVKRIEQILSDRTRLIERTQLKRDIYKSLGKLPPAKPSISVEKEDYPSKEAALSHDSHLKDHDTEIFDDSDFYHNLLRELIEHKAIDPHSPNIVVRQWLDIQKLRKKMKKTVDVKASKGRRIRYDVHAKLVNYMAPMDDCIIEEEPRKELFKSLFGKQGEKLVPVEDIRLFQSQKPKPQS